MVPGELSEQLCQTRVHPVPLSTSSFHILTTKPTNSYWGPIHFSGQSLPVLNLHHGAFQCLRVLMLLAICSLCYKESHHYRVSFTHFKHKKANMSFLEMES
jgi:hypothetical protein